MMDAHVFAGHLSAQDSFSGYFGVGNRQTNNKLIKTKIIWRGNIRSL